MTVQCCMCKMVRIDGEWNHHHQALRGDTSHTYCPVCLDVTLMEIHMEKQGREMLPVVA
jgi:hypothetical protein